MTNIETSPFVDRLLDWSLRHSIRPLTGDVIATVAIIMVGLIRALFVASIVPWLLFIPAVLLIALVLGRATGIYASILAAVVAGLSIGHASEPLWLTLPQWTGSIVFVAVASGIAILAAELRAAFARATRLANEKEAATLQLAEREAFLSSVLASSTDCIKVLDLDGRITFMSEGGQKVMEVSDFNEIAGCPWPDFWQDKGNVDARAAIAAAKAGESHSFTGRAETIAGTPKWWHVAVSPVLGQDGRPERILSVSRDITASREHEEERGQLVRIVENSADFISIARLDGSVFFLNDAACQLVGLDPGAINSVMIADFFPPAEAEAVLTKVLPAVTRDGSWSGERMFRHFQTGELIPVFYTVFPVTDYDGTLIGYGTVTRDFRERRRAEEQQVLLNHELSHRLKNVLSVVQSVAAQTLRQADNLHDAGEALSARLVALGEATNVLTAQSWASADLTELTARALAPHGGLGDRIHAEGPPVTLKPEVTLALALALHELATNAAKYGALSNATGQVWLSWSIDEETEPGGSRFLLNWRETGGPQVVPPTRRGFGSMMIERSLRSYFKATAQIEYLESGLVFCLDAPLGEAAMVSK